MAFREDLGFARGDFEKISTVFCEHLIDRTNGFQSGASVPEEALKAPFRIACNARLIETAHPLPEEPVREFLPLLEGKGFQLSVPLFTLKAVQHILGERELAYIWISHVELPHAGNVPALLRRYPHARVVAVEGGDYYALHGLENVRHVAPGDVMELGRHALEIVDPLFVDHGLTQWAFERTTGFFFTADWGHNLHEPARNQCFMFLDEMEQTGYTRELFTDDVKINAWYQFPWLVWSDPDELADAVEKLFEWYDIKIFAPSHGNLIRQEIKKYIGPLAEGMRQAAKMPRHLEL